MARKHNYSSQPDYGLYIDKDLEAANAKVRAEAARNTTRRPGESSMDHFRRFNAEFQSKKKRRNMFGDII